MEKQVGNPGSISLGCFLFHLVWGAKLEDASQVRIRLFGMFEKHVFVYLYYIYMYTSLSSLSTDISWYRMMGRVGGLKDNHEIFCALQICAWFKEFR